jgi:dimethylaniline monooxygenase (N-oxide forming)
MRVAIIGAGPSGLTTLKWLTTAHEYFDGLEEIEVRVFERELDLGGTFRHRTYKDSEVSDTSTVYVTGT